MTTTANVLIVYRLVSESDEVTLNQLVGLKHTSTNTVFFLNGQENQVPEVDFSVFDVVVLHHSLPVTQLEKVSQPLLLELIDFKGPIVWMNADLNGTLDLAKDVFDALPIRALISNLPKKEAQALLKRIDVSVEYSQADLSNFVSKFLEEQRAPKYPFRRIYDIAYRQDPYLHLTDEQHDLVAKAAQAILAYSKENKRVCEMNLDNSDALAGTEWFRYLVNCRTILGPPEPEDCKDTLPEVLLNAMASKTGLVLFEGDYEPLLTAGTHYIPLAKDFSNLDNVFETLQDTGKLQAMTEKAYADFIETKQFSLSKLAKVFDSTLKKVVEAPQAIELVTALVGAYPVNNSALSEFKPCPLGQFAHLKNVGFEPALVTTTPITASPIADAIQTHLMHTLPAPNDQAKNKRGLMEKVGKEVDRFYKRRIMQQQP